jgi:hypothetical protein
MRHLAAIASLLIGIALPACAQRAISHAGGGFSGHSAPAFHGGGGATHFSAPSSGFRPSAPYRAPAAPRYFGNTSRFAPANSINRYARAPYLASAYNRGDNHRPPYRPPHRPIYGGGLLYGYPAGVGWLGPSYYLGYPFDYGYDGYDDSGYDNSAATPYYPDQGYNQPPYDQDQPALAPAYQPPSSLPQSSPAPIRQDAVTLVFKDGRPSEQVHNYILSGTKISIWDQRPHDIPIAQLDLAATEKANRDAGVDFNLPNAAR